MQVILFTTLSAVLIPAIHCLLNRILTWPSNSAKGIIFSFGVYLLFCLLVTVLWKGLGPLDYVAVFSLAIFYCLGYMEAFSMICRGFSLRIMVDIRASNSLTLEEIDREYGDGRGTEWLLNKRLADLQEIGLIDVKNGNLEIKRPLGLLIGRMGLLMKAVLNMGLGG
jgi:hypothetical protein